MSPNPNSIFLRVAANKNVFEKKKNQGFYKNYDVKLWCSEFSNYKSELQNRFQQIEANSNS